MLHNARRAGGCMTSVAGVAPWHAGRLQRRRLLSGKVAGSGRIGHVAVGLREEAAALQETCTR
jgi:hypothetical protein